MQNLDWGGLGFLYRKTNAVVCSRYKDGQWSEPELVGDFNFNINAFAGVFHYGNSCFEGLKAFRGKDGKVRLFRPDENARRLKRSADRLSMACPSEELFLKMCLMCVKANLDFLPPYGYNASMYLRPVLEGIDPTLSICSSNEVLFSVMCSPVGTYEHAGVLSPVSAVVSRNYDRAAPNGTGSYKIGANYAMSLYPYNMAHSQGYNELLFLDPATKTCVDEFGSSNFIGIKGDTYVTPLSDSVLPSITNKSLRTIAEDLGMKVEIRPVPFEEVAEFDEINACGTAVVITPIRSIADKPVLESAEVSRTYLMPSGSECGKTSRTLYEHIRGIQDGILPDIHNWCVEL
jgi:branched-chain amino acid aminotransferase